MACYYCGYPTKGHLDVTKYTFTTNSGKYKTVKAHRDCLERHVAASKYLTELKDKGWICNPSFREFAGVDL
jgi:hypothetical protein